MRTTKLALAVLIAVALPACGGKDEPAPGEGTPDTLGFQAGERQFGGFGVSSGQPTEARLREVAPKMARVVSFRMPDENKDFDEAAVIADVGGTFESIPFSKATLKDEAQRKKAYAAFQAALEEPSKMTWFHCGSGNRVGALWALYRAEVEKKPVEEAIADGKAAGLTSLEPVVREILGGP